MVRRLVTVLLLGSAALSCGEKPPVMEMPVAEDCTNRRDDNGDGKTDCADPQCFENTACGATGENCENGTDDNKNGKIDCADPLCSGASCGPGCICIGGQQFFDDGGSSFGGGTAAGGGTASTGGGTAVTGGGTASTGGGTASTGGGTASTGGGTAVTGGGTASTGGGTASTGGGTAVTGGGTASTGGGTAVTGGGTASTGGGTAVTGGGTASTGGGTAVTGGGTASTGGGTAVTGGGTASTGGGTAVTGGGTASTGGGSGVDAGTNCGVLDCGELRCQTSPLCVNIQDGQACTADAQCAGGSCQTEAANGFPRGQCRNANSCTVGTNAGCHGGICVAGSTFNNCRARCTGTGLGATGRCRAGYACLDPDTNTTNNNSYCVPLCTTNSECAGTGAGYGCNTWSKLCGTTNQNKTKYGGACTSGANCESGFCLTGDSSPGGYCSGLCRGDTRNCGANGYCSFNSSYGDNVGTCLQSCTTQSQCRTSANYSCWQAPTGNDGVCLCLGADSSCNTGADCCSGVCFLFSYCL